MDDGPARDEDWRFLWTLYRDALQFDRIAFYAWIACQTGKHPEYLTRRDVALLSVGWPPVLVEVDE